MAANQARVWQEGYSTQPQPQKQTYVRKKSWITKGEKLLYSIIGICIIVALAYMVFFSSSIDTLNREVQTLEEQVQLQQLENQNLVNEINELSRPERIISIAEKNGLNLQDSVVKQANIFNHK